MRMDFALCFNDKYVPYACVTIRSIIQHAQIKEDIHIHILSDYISERNKRILHNLGNIHIYIVDNNHSFIKNLKTSVWSKYTWYRILLPSILDESLHKILYLDCDICINDNLEDLFSIDMKDNSIGACLDILSYDKTVYERLNYSSSKKYICAGVLMMNLNKWRETKLSERIIEYAIKNKDNIIFPDQDAINYVCQNDKIIFPNKYGVIVPFFRNVDFIRDYISEMEILIKRPAIIHYAGYSPWIYVKNKSLHAKLWWKTYNSLHAFPKIRLEYYLSFLKYCIRYILTNFHIIKSTNKYSLKSKYYNHPKISEKQVYSLINKVLYII